MGRTNLASGVSLDNIEFVNLQQLDSTLTNQYVFREREPRQLSDGRWEWLYGTPDGDVQALISEDGDFDDFESQDLVTADADGGDQD